MSDDEANEAIATAELSEPLRSIAESYRRFESEFRDFAEPLSETQANWRSAPGRWSIAECVQHLSLTGAVYVPVFEAAIVDARARGKLRPGPYRYGWMARLFVDALKPGSTQRFKSPRIFRPDSGTGEPADPSAIDFAGATKHLLEVQSSFCAAVERAEGVNLARVKVRSPAMRLLNLPLGAWLDAMALHQYRHLEQARRVASLDTFPGN